MEVLEEEVGVVIVPERVRFVEWEEGRARGVGRVGEGGESSSESESGSRRRLVLSVMVGGVVINLRG